MPVALRTRQTPICADQLPDVGLEQRWGVGIGRAFLNPGFLFWQTEGVGSQGLDKVGGVDRAQVGMAQCRVQGQEVRRWSEDLSPLGICENGGVAFIYETEFD